MHVPGQCDAGAPWRSGGSVRTTDAATRLMAMVGVFALSALSCVQAQAGRVKCDPSGVYTCDAGTTCCPTVQGLTMHAGRPTSQCPSDAAPLTHDLCAPCATGFWGCCAAVNASCCADYSHCCPHGFPVCGPGGSCKKKMGLAVATAPGLSVQPPSRAVHGSAGAHLTKQCNDTFLKDCPGLWNRGTQCLVCLHKHGADMMAHGCPNASWPQLVFKVFCETPAPPPPITDCENTHSTKAACDADAACAWCTSAAVPPSCERIADAKRLPPSVFKCDKVL